MDDCAEPQACKTDMTMLALMFLRSDASTGGAILENALPQCRFGVEINSNNSSFFNTSEPRTFDYENILAGI